MKNKLVILIVALIVIVPIVLNEIKEKDLKNLKKDILSLASDLEEKNGDGTGISKTIKIDEKNRKGNIFITEDGISIIVDYKGYCAVKWPGVEVALSKSKCPKYVLKNGQIVKN